MTAFSLKRILDAISVFLTALLLLPLAAICEEPLQHDAWGVPRLNLTAGKPKRAGEIELTDINGKVQGRVLGLRRPPILKASGDDSLRALDVSEHRLWHIRLPYYESDSLTLPAVPLIRDFSIPSTSIFLAAGEEGITEISLNADLVRSLPPPWPECRP